jgi:hypothetical protein
MCLYYQNNHEMHIGGCLLILRIIRIIQNNTGFEQNIQVLGRSAKLLKAIITFFVNVLPCPESKDTSRVGRWGYNNNLDALFTLSLLNYHTATFFGRINTNHQDVECIFVANGTCYTSE